MDTSELPNHAPLHPVASPPLPHASNLVLIDNYDSFTWNVYQYLVLAGATVQVFRNDALTLPDLIKQNPTQLVISPGPGHPDTDAGLSTEAIKHFAGKIPVLGVCMGEQCIFQAFGGRVDVTGEVLHGKTSTLAHDGRGMYEAVPQGVPVTRYHSLAGTHISLPDSLEVSSWIAVPGEDSKAGYDGRGVIMGVRHKQYTVEGCQFHPESILTEEGRTMLENFLRVRGGTWAEDKAIRAKEGLPERPKAAAPVVNGQHRETDKQGSILERIFAKRKERVAAQKSTPSQRPQDLQAMYNLNIAPPQVDFVQRLRRSPYQLSLMAEVKRASPSKGIIALDVCAPEQAKKYALAGASVISVLTEPDWFKGSMDDLRAVRQVLEGMPNRPAVLRKEFVFEEYQILEARLGGADTVLLIVKMLDEETLSRLYHYSCSLGMEPLVEVNTPEEMEVAVRLGSRVIGVNNRNLANFEVDLETTSRLMDQVPKETIVAALSGISGPQDVEAYQKNGVGAVLVGEALMRAKDTAVFVNELLGGNQVQPTRHQPTELLVKICGTRTPEAAKTAIEAGADLIGMILVEGRSRFVPEDTAIAISEVVHGTLKDRQTFARTKKDSLATVDFFAHTSQHHITAKHRALLVGVFQNQELSYVLEQQKLLDLDIVQLHGDEPLEWADLIPVPVIKSFKPGDIGIARRGYHAVPLLDAGAGGSGQSVDQTAVKDLMAKDEQLRILLAGGLNPDNVKEKVAALGDLRGRIVGVDVSSGVEESGKQSLEKIKQFIAEAKSL